VKLTLADAARQSLTTGTAGAALLAAERALTGTGRWDTARARITALAQGPVDGGDQVGFYHGAPAIRFILACADADHQGRYQQAAICLDAHVARIAAARLAAARDRMRAGATPHFREYDLLYGLTGIGALLAITQPGSEIHAATLSYAVAMTTPRRDSEGWIPGWYAANDPDPLLPTPGGHANLGMAHGAAGLAAFLATSMRHGHVVSGQADAIAGLLDFFATWQQDSDDGPWWPQWLTRSELAAGRTRQAAPGRPSWCYGAVGVARALQLAGIATRDTAAQVVALAALRGAVTPRPLTKITDAGLCHGAAGIIQTLARAAADSSEALHDQYCLAGRLLAELAPAHEGPGLLTGSSGTELARHAAGRAAPPRSGWDRCLLIV
jgi:hypothetical protein